jgi:hypothetical protein
MFLLDLSLPWLKAWLLLLQNGIELIVVARRN